MFAGKEQLTQNFLKLFYRKEFLSFIDGFSNGKA
jgi:hypothetical protein